VLYECFKCEILFYSICVMLKTSAMATCKPSENKRNKHKDGVINNLKDLFGNVLHIDIIRTVASECDFDVQRSSNLLLEMTNNIDEQPFKKKEKPKPKKSPQHNTQPAKRPQNLTLRPQPSPNKTKSRKTLELERVINNIRKGYKVLVLLRGLPGSGKSRLAVVITDVTLGPGTNSHHILSTDDFWVQTGRYVFDSSRLQEAHGWNHSRAFQAMSRGLSPVIIDNTNTQMWEMKPYAMMATDYGYIIEIVEPDTWWCFNDKELAKRNTHNVPRATIKDMLERYEKNVTPHKLLCAYNLGYKFQRPPQLRLFPPIIHNVFYRVQQNGPIDRVTKSKSTSALDRQISVENGIENINLMDFSDVSNEDADKNQNHNQNFWDVNPVDEILMCTEESSGDVLQPNQITSSGANSSSKSDSDKVFRDIENAWGVDAKALESWDIVTPITCDPDQVRVMSNNDQEEVTPETRDAGSVVEPGDYLRNDSDVPDGFKVISAQSRDINLDSPVRRLTPRKKIMIDKSCTAEDLFDHEGKSEEAYIRDLLDLFPRVPRSSLREFFNKCNKNFQWTVDLLLDDANLEVAEGQDEEMESEPVETATEVDESFGEEHEPAPQREVKVFKHKPISEDSLELKRCLEGKIDINKEHYSEHVIKVKQTKFGSYQEPQASTSTAINSDVETDSEDDDSSSHSDDNPKNMIELNLGEVFVGQLETMFGGDDGAFPKGYQPVVQMPVGLARQIYSFYVESICQQMEAQNYILEGLVKEDEDFARKLQSQEEPRVPERPPNLMEIMDEQVALNLHKRDVDEWKNMTADSLAAKLTKQKLFSTFPNVDKEALLEIWHALDYDYNRTVEDLMASVGPDYINGSRETIAEPPLSKTTLDEMKEAEEDCTEVEVICDV
jgi:predicted kinase